MSIMLNIEKTLYFVYLHKIHLLIIPKSYTFQLFKIVASKFNIIPISYQITVPIMTKYIINF